jgi:polyribonucleotide nucleotidyltransferase
MFNIVKKQINWGGRTLTLETGRIARQAGGAVLATYGETVVLCTVVTRKTASEGIDFLPLTVVYQEKAFAAGKIPGGFFKREARPSEKETLTSRLIDRTIRPLFPANYFNETQVICTVLQHDLSNDPDMTAFVGAAAAIAISDIPFDTTAAGVRVGIIDGQMIINPAVEDKEKSTLELVIGGTADSILMVESEAQEFSEEQMLEAINFGHDSMRQIIAMINDFASQTNKEKNPVPAEKNQDLKQQIAALISEDLKQAYKLVGKSERSQKLDLAKEKAIAGFADKGFTDVEIIAIFKELQQNIVRRQMIETGIRIDGRDAKTVRPIDCQIGVLPRTHGSALFTRGETQALVVVTLGTTQDEQIMDLLEKSDARERFMLHYNFPPYSVGEASPLRAPGRREIGHGNLAKRAINPMMPNKETFPYTVRMVSEITESNGSSSMASVCGGSLALMDAGVPIAKPVAGIAMGLIKEQDAYVVLSDIMGDEDYLGDMDFKVAGTKDGITSLQMDIKIKGISNDIMKIALSQAKEGRMHILGIMENTINKAKSQVSEYAPTVETIMIPKDKIREVIGSGGKVIKDICEKSGAKVEIDDTGKVQVIGTGAKAIAIAVEMINNIIAVPEVGALYKGKVVKIADFGAFVNFMGGTDGLVHISELTDARVEKVSDVVQEGDEVLVKLIGVDNRGKFKLSMKAVDEELAKE